MPVRDPIVAHRFYPGDGAACRQAVARHMSRAQGAAEATSERQGPILGAVVPHAGWVYSGDTAARVYSALEGQQVETVVFFGAVHSWGVLSPSLFGSGAWRTPLGDVHVDGELAKLVMALGAGQIVDRPAAHAQEHSLEVQMPFVHYALPQARILPIAVPPEADAGAIGRLVARCAQEASRRAVAIGSSDLTHYGPNYGLAPAGVGEPGLAWALANDQRLLELALALRIDEIVPEAETHHNACGAGAIAAAMGFAAELGARRGVLLEHVTSHQVRPYGPPADMVGYGALIFVA